MGNETTDSNAMRHRIISGPGGIMTISYGDRSIILILSSKVFSNDIKDRLKDIDTKPDACRFSLYRNAFGDGALGVTDEPFLELIQPHAGL